MFEGFSMATRISAALVLMGCGGGGAAVAPAEQSAPQNPGGAPQAPPAAPAQPSPGSTTISTSGSRFNPATVTIAPGSTVVWQIVETTHNVTFGANKPQGGDVPDTSSGSSVSRVFPAAGTFSYECTRHSGMTGQIVVQAGATVPVPPPPPSAPSPSGAIVTATATDFLPEEIEITPGTTVTWEFTATNNVTFDDDRPPGGDIPDSPPGARVSRTFPALGDFDYTSTRNRGMKGRIRVRKD